VSAELTAIVGATLIDGTGRDPVPDSVVLIDGDRISAAGPGTQVPVPDGARRVDAAGAHLIPGLMDANVHLVAAIFPDYILQFEGRYEELALEAAQVCLAAGFTTVFDTWGPTAPLVAVRERINRGEVPGARMFVAGNIIGFGGPFSSDFFAADDLIADETRARINEQWERGVGADLMWLTADGVRERVREYVETSGVDFLKYAASGHAVGEMHFITFSAEAQRAIVEEGHRAGMTVQAHTTSVESLRMEIEAGADILQHGNLTGQASIPEPLLDIIVERQLPVAALYYTAAYIAWARENKVSSTYNEHLDHNNRRLIETGANLLLTTDGFAWGRAIRHPKLAKYSDGPDFGINLGDAHVVWLKAVLEQGMSPMDALVAATRNPAVAYGHPDLGTLEPGKIADLVLLDADPLADPENYLRIRAVWKDGAEVDRDALPDPRVLTEPA
jgi:imidazolonepropionase-like amidohydrolase